MIQGNNLLRVCLVLALLGSVVPDQRTNELLNIPQTNFKCEDYEWPGYYADIEAGCQVFHICVHRPRSYDQFSFLCPNGTAFDQQLLVCSWETSFDCETTSEFFHINGRIYQTEDVPKTTGQGTNQGRDLVVTQPSLPQPEPTGTDFDDFDTLALLRSRKPSSRNRQTSGRGLDLGGSKFKSVDSSNQVSNSIRNNQFSTKDTKTSNLSANPRGSSKFTDSTSNSFGRPLPKNKAKKTSNLSANPRGSAKFTNTASSSFGRPLPTSSKPNTLIQTTSQAASRKATTAPKLQSIPPQSKKTQKLPISGRPLPTFGQRSRQPVSTTSAKKPPTVKLNIPSKRPLSAEIVRNQNTKKPEKTSSKKTSVLFINSAEAEKNPEKQRKVYVNTIKLPDNGVKQSTTRNTQLNTSRRQPAINPSQPEIAVKKAPPPSRQGGVALPLGRLPSSRSFARTANNRATARHRFSTVSLDHSIESGGLGLIASSIFQLPPPGK